MRSGRWQGDTGQQCLQHDVEPPRRKTLGRQRSAAGRRALAPSFGVSSTIISDRQAVALPLAGGVLLRRRTHHTPADPSGEVARVVSPLKRRPQSGLQRSFRCPFVRQAEQQQCPPGQSTLATASAAKANASADAGTRMTAAAYRPEGQLGALGQAAANGVLSPAAGAALASEANLHQYAILPDPPASRSRLRADLHLQPPHQQHLPAAPQRCAPCWRGLRIHRGHL